jgi:hypothetical protein
LRRHKKRDAKRKRRDQLRKAIRQSGRYKDWDTGPRKQRWEHIPGLEQLKGQFVDVADETNDEPPAGR